MSRKLKILCLLLAAALLSGCSLRTVDQLYCLPKRSQEHANLQTIIDRCMTDLSYCAPLSGENPQTVQIADLEGDGVEEYLVFAKGGEEKPLNILIFRMEGNQYVLSDTIVSAGSAFDLVEYAHMDDYPGCELIVGCQVSEQLTRSVSVYRFADGKAEQLLNANYTRFITCDLDENGREELMVLHPGESDESNGVAELYSYYGGAMERSNQVSMSESVDHMKRIVEGKLQGGQPGIYVASTTGEMATVTDVFTLDRGLFVNAATSSSADTLVQTLGNYYVYPADIDDDGIMELPWLVNMELPGVDSFHGAQYLIRWYAITPSGAEAVKYYTYHNFQGGWYLSLDNSWAPRMAAVQREGGFDFYIWTQVFDRAQKVFSINSYIGEDRQERAEKDGKIVLLKNDTILYAAALEPEAGAFGITQETLIGSFHLIHQDWKIGEK